ncbi:unnamed protein product [Acanthoscelides obtectus]|uniref:Serine palmitoyltransferase 1 n=1 Tax=Acanthoscelides obtectus TaxID=200917 RepID=A0A9P0PU02_ACAOB|nr:unnamed protein product [Acanthoscelides obtectus]CAK1660788.1 Serine palmitoyltransferase 1 [Acanthoscelides obtectus]
MLDEKLLQERLEQFNPEPLVPLDHTLGKAEIESDVVPKDENTIDLVKVNFLNFLDNDGIKKSCENTIRKYGVGTCGPRAFYGTTDLHLDLEKRLAEFLKTESSIVYSYGFVAISSSIAAYCKRSDTVFIDEKANIAIRQGLQSSRCKIVEFKHNDPSSLKEEVSKVTKKEGKRKSRKFLIVEGVSWATGKLLPLEDFLKVAEANKMRIFLEETYSIGVYGKHGRGLTEHFDIDPARIDMIIATLETSVGSIGGFCAGSDTIIEHQSLSGSGYIFSASLSTFLVQACIDAVNIMESTPQVFEDLRKLAKYVHNFLVEVGYKVESDPESGFKVFKASGNEEKIYSYCKENGVHLIYNKEKYLVMNLNVELYKNNKIQKVYDVLKEASAL